MAWAISISEPVNGSSLPRNRFKAPMTSVRTRSGTAHITWKPALDACGAKTGQRARLSAALAWTARPVGVRVQARALRALELEQLKQPHPLVRGGDQPQPAARVGQHHPRGLGPENLNRVLGQAVQEIDNVKVAGQRVRQPDEGPGQHGLAGHVIPPAA